jgi:dissimilatory sulfite reductase (desulfoviridin) alpha/beta subunit
MDCFSGEILKMEWSKEAQDAVKKVPFFVRKKVRSRVEKEAMDAGAGAVTLAEVNRAREKFLEGMDASIQGYRIDGCFGSSGCPNRAMESEGLRGRIEEVLKEADILGFLRKSVDGKLKYHHEFSVTLADCPNACSQPQIRDIGIVGALSPVITDEVCTLCRGCVESCREDAITLDAESGGPMIDVDLCIDCGECVRGCPTGTLQGGENGYVVMLGGKLGRHPRLASRMPGIWSGPEVEEIVAACLSLYKDKSTGGRRFSELLTEPGFRALCDRFKPACRKLSDGSVELIYRIRRTADAIPEPA